MSELDTWTGEPESESVRGKSTRRPGFGWGKCLLIILGLYVLAMAVWFTVDKASPAPTRPWWSFCDRGWFAHPTRGECVRCRAGYYDAEDHHVWRWDRDCDTICPENTYCPEGSTAPIDCPPGTVAGNGSAVCTACPPLTIPNWAGAHNNPDFAASACIACAQAVGFGANTTDTSILIPDPSRLTNLCVNCTKGNYVLLEPASNSAVCVPCPCGYAAYFLTGSRFRCDLCPTLKTGLACGTTCSAGQIVNDCACRTCLNGTVPVYGHTMCA